MSRIHSDLDAALRRLMDKVRKEKMKSHLKLEPMEGRLINIAEQHEIVSHFGEARVSEASELLFWSFEADDIQCFIWSDDGIHRRGVYKTWGPSKVFEQLFPGRHKAQKVHGLEVTARALTSLSTLIAKDQSCSISRRCRSRSVRLDIESLQDFRATARIHKTGRLSSINALSISRILGFVSGLQGPSKWTEILQFKVNGIWLFRVEGELCGIWDWKGSQVFDAFSTFGPHKVMEQLFGDHYSAYSFTAELPSFAPTVAAMSPLSSFNDKTLAPALLPRAMAMEHLLARDFFKLSDKDIQITEQSGNFVEGSFVGFVDFQVTAPDGKTTAVNRDDRYSPGNLSNCCSRKWLEKQRAGWRYRELQTTL